MKLSVGMYLRYEGKIGKYKGYAGNDRGELYTYDFTTFEIDSDDSEDEIIDLYNLKASHNLIDLIEVGDYVNGSLVIEIRDYAPDNIKRILTERSAMYSVTIREDELLDNLKSIVTKEQFESMSYKVVE